MSNLRLHVDTDSDAESPLEWGWFKMASFSTKHHNFQHPHDFDGEEWQERFEAGTAFKLSYYAHGSSVWSLQGEGPTCQWDSVPYAGVLWYTTVSEAGTTKEHCIESARSFLAEYTEWCNGDCFQYALHEVEKCDHGDWHEVGLWDSCCGFIGWDNVVVAISEAVGKDDRIVDICGNMAHSFDLKVLA